MDNHFRRLPGAAILVLGLLGSTRSASAQTFSSPPEPVSPSGSVSLDHPTFSWTAATRATGDDANTRYTLELWNPDLDEVLIKTGISSLSYALTPETIGTGAFYTWWVRASDSVTGDLS